MGHWTRTRRKQTRGNVGNPDGALIRAGVGSRVFHHIAHGTSPFLLDRGNAGFPVFVHARDGVKALEHH